MAIYLKEGLYVVKQPIWEEVDIFSASFNYSYITYSEIDSLKLP